MPAKSSDPAPLILACDTTQAACSVALYQAGILAAQCAEMSKGHAEALMPMLESVLAETETARRDVRRLAVTHGPGTFTGVRVGLSAMRGLALALDLPVKTYGTLAVMAAAHKYADDPLLVAVDAKRDTFYAQAFDANGEAMNDPAALTAAQLAALAQSTGAERMAVCGTGAPLLAAKYGRAFMPAMRRLIRKPFIWPKWRRKMMIGRICHPPSRSICAPPMRHCPTLKSA